MSTSGRNKKFASDYEDEDEEKFFNPRSGNAVDDDSDEEEEELNYPENPRPQRFDRSGALLYTSLIPPMPPELNPAFIQSASHKAYQKSKKNVEVEPEVGGSGSQRMRQLENQPRPEKYYKEPAVKSPKAPFPAKFVGVTEGDILLLQYSDDRTMDAFRLMNERIIRYFGGPEGHAQRSLATVMLLEDMDEQQIVLVKWQDDPCRYVRGRIVKICHEKGTVLIKDIDSWDYAYIQFNHVFYMDRMFMDLPAMVQRCKLKLLEAWLESKVLTEMTPILPRFYDTVRVLDVVEDAAKFPVVTVRIKLKGRYPNKWTSDEFTTLSELLLRFIGGFTRIPRQFFRGRLVERCHASIVQRDGTCWVQMHSNLATKLSFLGEDPVKILTSEEYTSNAKGEDGRILSPFEYSYFVLGDRRFLAMYKDDRQYYRVQVLETELGCQEVKVQYLDFGNTDVIPVEDVLPTAMVNPLLNKIPVQAFGGYLNGIDEILDVDQFYEKFSVNSIQEVMIAGFKESPSTPLLDLYIMFDPNKPEWTYVNQYLVDNGLATASKEIVRYPRKDPVATPRPRQDQGESFIEGGIMRWRQVDKKYGLERRRFYTSCRIVDVEAGVFAIVKKKSKK